MNRRLIPAMVAAVLVLAACGPGDVLVFDELPFPVVDLSESDDPAVRASSEAWEETLATQDAEEALDRGIENHDLATIREAGELKPDDPKYPIYEQFLTDETTLDQICEIESVESSDPNVGTERGNCAPNPTAIERRRSLTNDALWRVYAQHPESTPSERKRIVMEMQINALRDLIQRSEASPLPEDPVEAERRAAQLQSWKSSYCFTLNTTFPQKFKEEFPLDTITLTGAHSASAAVICRDA